MSSLTMNPGGEISLPKELQKRYGLSPDTPIRIVETRSGILLIPLTNEAIGEELAQEIADWQSLSAHAWEMFPYEDEMP
jgi:hypothetical protein